LRILHVSLGLPPLRTGGLNRYCIDLMEEQRKHGQEVAMLYPGEYTLGGGLRIEPVKDSRYRLSKILNPLPLALTSGIRAPARYMSACGGEAYRRFLLELKPDVVHVHSIQGIHKEFFDAARSQGIRMVFTTHDYYPFCPNCVTVDSDGRMCDGPDPLKCSICGSRRGFSRAQEIVMQSSMYARYKNSFLLKKLRAGQNSKAMEKPGRRGPVRAADPRDYQRLLDYYRDIMRAMGVVHCNSDVARGKYASLFPGLNYITIPITHQGIACGVRKNAGSGALRIGYLGGKASCKGLDVLLEAVRIMDAAGERGWELWLYGADYAELRGKDARIHDGGQYGPPDQGRVWNSFDVLAVPSLWPETFGFVVLEALAWGVPVICSDLVGAKALLPPGMVVQHGSAKALAARLMEPLEACPFDADAASIEKHEQRMRGLYLESE